MSEIHQQNNEPQQPPVLPLDPSSVAKEKVQLVLVMSRAAQLYLLDEPIGGVDPATRDYILNTIVSNYNQTSTVIISTHLISDVEKVLDEVMFMQKGALLMDNS